MTVPMKTQKRPPKPPLSNPTLKELRKRWVLGLRQCEINLSCYRGIHQYIFPSSRVDRDKAERGEKAEVALRLG